MTTMPGSPWSVTLGYSHPMALALALRDALGIVDPIGLPPVQPLPQLTVTHAGEAASHWQTWWDHILSSTNQDDHQPPLPPADNPLRRIVENHLGTLHPWSTARKRDLATASRPTRGTPRLRDAIHDHEHTTGTPLGSFHLRVTALPLTGPVLLPLDRDHLLVSITLLQDRTDYHRRILKHLAPCT